MRRFGGEVGGQSHEFEVASVWDDQVHAPGWHLTGCSCGWLGGCSDTSPEGEIAAERQWLRHVADTAMGRFGRRD